jgi:hypothetical protein
MSMIIDGTNGLTFNNATTQNSGGQVLQVVQGIYNTFGSTTSTSYTDTGLTVSITPKFSTSKILVLITLNIEGRADTVGCGVNAQIVRGSTVVFISERSVNIDAAASGNARVIGGGTMSISYLDSPATTSSTAYKVQYGLSTTANNAIGYVNNSSNAGNGQSVITLMEIAG